MQDKYVKTMDKIRMDEKRKIEMRQVLEKTMASKPAKKTRLSGGAKAGIAAAVVAVTMGSIFCIPSARNAINASIKGLFAKEVPVGAVDEVERVKQGREDRVIPTDVPEASEIQEIVAQQDQEEDQFFEDVTVTSDYYTDPELNAVAKNYAEQGYTLMDLAKAEKYDVNFDRVQNEEWFSEGFTISYQIGDNAYGYQGNTVVFKATEQQLDNFLNNELSLINYERADHGQTKVTFDEMWAKGTDDEGNIVYTGNWTGPEPEVKFFDSDSARFITYEVTYDPVTQIAICVETNGGGVG